MESCLLLRWSLALACLAVCSSLSPRPAQARVFTGDGQDFYVLQNTEEYGLGEPEFPDIMVLHASASAGGDNWFTTWGSAWDDNTQRADSGIALASDPSGALFVAGASSAFAFPTAGMALLKFASSGEVLGAKLYGWTNHTLYTKALVVDGGGNIFLTGAAMIDLIGDGTDVDFWAFTLKCDPGGNVLWARRWTLNRYAEGAAIGVDSSGNVWVAGTIDSQTSSHSDGLLLKYSGNDGALLMAQSWSWSNSFYPLALVLDGADNVYITGQLVAGTFPDPYYPELGVANMDIVLLKYGAGGSLHWAQAFGSGYPETPRDLAVDLLGRVYIAGATTKGFMPPVGSVVNGDPDTDGLALIFDAAGPLVQARSTVQLAGGDYKESLLGVFFGGDGELYSFGHYGDYEQQLMDAKGGYWQVGGSVGYPVATEEELSAVSLVDLEGGQQTIPLSDAELDALLAGKENHIGQAVWETAAPPAP